MEKQKGMTLIGMLFLTVVIIVVGITTMRVVPVYLRYYEINESVKGLNNFTSEDSTDMVSNAELLKRNLLKRFAVNSIDETMFTVINFVPIDVHRFNVILKYKEIRPLIANVSLLFDFDINQEVKIGSN